MTNTITILQQLLIDTNSDHVLLFDSKGNLIDSIIDSNQESISAMGGAIMSMCEKFLEDLKKGLLKQVYITTSNGHVLFSKVNTSVNLVVFNNDKVNTGLLFHNVDEACSKLSKELN